MLAARRHISINTLSPRHDCKRLHEKRGQMDIQLNEVEVRALGALIEKELTTPEYYPLTLNSLTMACNQKSNRDPIVAFDNKTVLRAVESMRDKNLTMLVTGGGSRVAKYKHTFARRFQFNEKEVAVLCALMLRGRQTVGEIRGRSARLHDFADLGEVSATLNGLMKRGGGAYVIELPREPGRKESRYAHLFCGTPVIPEVAIQRGPEPVRGTLVAENDRFAKLEEEISFLREELTRLKSDFDEFRKA